MWDMTASPRCVTGCHTLLLCGEGAASGGALQAGRQLCPWNNLSCCKETLPPAWGQWKRP